MPTPTQRRLRTPGDHHLTICREESRPFAMPKGRERLLCELPIGHDTGDGHAATIEGTDIRWRGGRGA